MTSVGFNISVYADKITEKIVTTVFDAETLTEKPVKPYNVLSPVREEKVLLGNRGFLCIYISAIVVFNLVGVIYLSQTLSSWQMVVMVFCAGLIFMLSPLPLDYQYLVPENSQLAILLEIDGSVYREFIVYADWFEKINSMRVFNLLSWSARSKVDITKRYYYKNIEPDCEISKEKFEKLAEILVGINACHDTILISRVAKLRARLDAAREKKIAEVLTPILAEEDI